MVPSVLVGTHSNLNIFVLSHKKQLATSSSFVGISAFPFLPTSSPTASFISGTAVSQILYRKGTSLFLQNGLKNTRSKKLISLAPRCSPSSNSNDNKDQTKTPFGYTRKDVLLIGIGVTLAGVGLKSGLEKRLEGLTEAELEALLEQVEEEKQRQASGEQI
ncbi:hypothetical protein REPUB_Repub07fG0092600 [Reevesia pubescens]